MKILILCALLALAGCATCQRHPVMCTVAGAIVVGSIAATLAQHDHSDHAQSNKRMTQPTPCQANPAMCL
jgi:hypothetical protein